MQTSSRPLLFVVAPAASLTASRMEFGMRHPNHDQGKGVSSTLGVCWLSPSASSLERTELTTVQWWPTGHRCTRNQPSRIDLIDERAGGSEHDWVVDQPELIDQVSPRQLIAEVRAADAAVSVRLPAQRVDLFDLFTPG